MYVKLIIIGQTDIDIIWKQKRAKTNIEEIKKLLLVEQVAPYDADMGCSSEHNIEDDCGCPISSCDN